MVLFVLFDYIPLTLSVSFSVKAGIKRQEASECENIVFAKITQIMRFKIDVLTLNCYYCIRKGGMRDASAV